MYTPEKKPEIYLHPGISPVFLIFRKNSAIYRNFNLYDKYRFFQKIWTKKYWNAIMNLWNYYFSEFYGFRLINRDYIFNE